MRLEALASLLDRIVPVLAATRRVVAILTLIGAVATLATGWALFADGLPEGGDALAVRIVVLALAASPAVVLTVLWLALGEVIEIPGRVRRLPETVRGHADELERAARRLEEGKRISALWRLATLPAAARESLLIYAPLTAFLSVPFLLASACSALIVPVELVVALVAVALTA
jgi:hypothetical protein